MNNPRHVLDTGRLAGFACAAVLAATILAPSILRAAEPESPPQFGYGMMGGHGYGMGYHGMMGGGYGMGPSMMGGYGMGHGMMGGFWGGGLELTDEQQASLNKIQDETRKEHWALMGSMQDQQARLRDLRLAPKPDSAAIDAAYRTIGKLQQQMYDSSVAARKRMEAVLTPEQQEKLRSYWRRGWGP